MHSINFKCEFLKIQSYQPFGTNLLKKKVIEFCFNKVATLQDLQRYNRAWPFLEIRSLDVGTAQNNINCALECHLAHSCFPLMTDDIGGKGDIKSSL